MVLLSPSSVQQSGLREGKEGCSENTPGTLLVSTNTDHYIQGRDGSCEETPLFPAPSHPLVPPTPGHSSSGKFPGFYHS